MANSSATPIPGCCPQKTIRLWLRSRQSRWGQEVLLSLDRFGEPLEQQRQILGAVYEVDLRRIDHQQVAGRVMEEKVLIGLRHLLDIRVTDGLFLADALALESLLQHLGRSVQINHQVRRGHLAAEDLVEAVVEGQFRIR